jgi:mannobiose 2-epimerase
MRKAAQVIGDNTLLRQVEKASNIIAEITLKEGISKENGVLYEGNSTKVLNPEKHWWPQAEGMVGFLDTYGHTKNEEYLQMVYKIWEFTKKYIVNPSGEWFWLVDDNNKTDPKHDKVSPWKGPYHNARACLELLNRFECVLVG